MIVIIFTSLFSNNFFLLLLLETKKAVEVAKTKITTAYADNNSDDTNKTDETEKAVDKE